MILPTLDAAGEYEVILADPAWPYNARNNDGTRFGRGVHGAYATMTVDEIARLPVGEHAAPRSALFLWATGPHLGAAYDVARAWGFEPIKPAMVWIKTGTWKRYRPTLQARLPTSHDVSLILGPGAWTMSNAEYLLLGMRGRPRLARARRDVGEIIMAPRREHSRKPDDARMRIAAMFPSARRLELFARDEWPGFDAVGIELGSEPMRPKT